MKLYWSTLPNFGDSLNPWLWNRLLPGLLDDNPSELLVGIGTILNHKLPAAGHKHVFGSGFGYGWLPTINPTDFTIWCVRGPRTAAKLGLAPDLAITDPAILLRNFMAPAKDRGDGVVFIPHFESMPHGDWRDIAELAGCRLVDPRMPVETVMHEIGRADLVIAEAMHGAIVADALRVPWVPVRPLNRKNAAKWFDWFDSLSLKPRPRTLPPSTLHEALTGHYSGIREAAKDGLEKLRLARFFADRTPIDAAFGTHERTRQECSGGDRVRMMADGIVPALDRMVIPPFRKPLARFLREKAAAALQAMARAEPTLSSDAVFDRSLSRLNERVEALRRHLAQRR